MGFPLGLDVHVEDCTTDEAREICPSLPRHIEKTVITYLDHAADVVALCRRVGVSIIQIHGDMHIRELSRLREIAPDFTVIKSLVVKPENREDLFFAVERWTPWVDAFITDTYDPVTGASGATGKTHDWTVSRALVAHGTKPVILAGGLTPFNVAAAIFTVRPWGVDCHTGVESCDGRKDYGLVRTFVLNAQAAFAALGI